MRTAPVIQRPQPSPAAAPLRIKIPRPLIPLPRSASDTPAIPKKAKTGMRSLMIAREFIQVSSEVVSFGRGV